MSSDRLTPRPGDDAAERSHHGADRSLDGSAVDGMLVDSVQAPDGAHGLMAIGRVGPDDAFDLLRTVSQRTNRKLREIADEVVHTGQLPELPAK